MHYTPNTLLAFSSVEHIIWCVLKTSLYAGNSLEPWTLPIKTLVGCNSFKDWAISREPTSAMDYLLIDLWSIDHRSIGC